MLRLDEENVPLFEVIALLEQNDQNQPLTKKVWFESKKLWQVVGPAIFTRIASYTMLVIFQAFVGHLRDTELASLLIATSVIVGVDI